MLKAARELFATSGYSNTTTREIAFYAGVAENLLFKHFGSKAALFEQAIFEPFKEAVAGFVEKWESYSTDPHTMGDVARDYIEGLYDLLSEHRELIMALMTVRRYESGVADGTGSPLADMLDQLERIGSQELMANQVEGVNVRIAIRLMFGMVASITALDDWLFDPGERHPSRDEIIDEIVAFILHGSAHHRASMASGIAPSRASK